MIKFEDPRKFQIQSSSSQTARRRHVLNFGFAASCFLGSWILVLGSFAHAAGTSAHAADFFTIVALPDTQYYTELEAKSEQYFKGQTRWIVANRDKEHIAFVTHLGDIQQDGMF